MGWSEPGIFRSAARPVLAETGVDDSADRAEVESSGAAPALTGAASPLLATNPTGAGPAVCDTGAGSVCRLTEGRAGVVGRGAIVAPAGTGNPVTLRTPGTAGDTTPDGGRTTGLSTVGAGLGWVSARRAAALI